MSTYKYSIYLNIRTSESKKYLKSCFHCNTKKQMEENHVGVVEVKVSKRIYPLFAIGSHLTLLIYDN